MKSCHDCGQAWENVPGAQPGRSEVCAKCGADLHCCRNCNLYDPSAPRQCSSRTTDQVNDKEKGNYCDEFEFGTGGKSGPGESGGMESKWKDLFH